MEVQGENTAGAQHKGFSRARTSPTQVSIVLSVIPSPIERDIFIIISLESRLEKEE
jgi:hypothetical protein